MRGQPRTSVHSGHQEQKLVGSTVHPSQYQYVMADYEDSMDVDDGDSGGDDDDRSDGGGGSGAPASGLWWW